MFARASVESLTEADRPNCAKTPYRPIDSISAAPQSLTDYFP
jgi:hypothetical protein